ncbi:right-handed parallel beta-helix repeat-containing protein [Amycolatopsis mongoliensis]|uniref:Right-handed parallel beta-helix repeat-containing protein n=1 Tax=Amycolatopsis mongoliensis TaxID=715475 RepID=A0A9Y2JIM0_9PSEU|nr:right-handed parallel beta-helix repeat-containing protein [Amycolatopsis sp. 4-36]WIX99194.1 right-handed parallel beta-helix repeat-containing protein [Amycolatopsis sp. 4-36]
MHPGKRFPAAGARTRLRVTVLLRGGTYRLTRTLDLPPTAARVAFRAAPGETPVLTGARRVTGFTKTDAARGIYTARVPAGTGTRQLFVDGVRAERARTALDPATFTVTATGFSTPDPSFAALTNQTGVEVVQENKWKHLRCPLASISRDGTGSALTVQPECWRNNNTAVVNRQFPFNGNGLPKLDGVSWVENAYELLTKPGQWYLDQAAGRLSYLPLPGQDMTKADVEVPLLETLVKASGTPGHLAPADDDTAAYRGAWTTSANRQVGDYQDGVHATSTPGASVSYAFTGTGLDVLAETGTGLGAFTATVDGRPDPRPHTEAGDVRLAQQVVHSLKDLPKGRHTVTLTSASDRPFLVDAFVVTPDVVAPVRDLSFSGLTFTGTTWTLPSRDGYVDNQAGVQWAAAAPHAPIRPPAALEIHRGRGISVSGNTFRGLGGAGLALADGTQDARVTRNRFADTSAGAIASGEVDDYYLSDPARMTLGTTIADNTITTPGQDYHDAVGIWAGHGRATTIEHNEIADAPYSGISLGWGWGWASPCELQAEQGLTVCRRGTIYSGGNRILGNDIHDVMRTLLDGGPVYTLGGQDSTVESVTAGNWVHDAPHNNNMLYHDEGSSYWNTYGNVVSNRTGRWTGMWTPTIHDIRIHGNFTDNTVVKNLGTNVVISDTTVVTGGNWPDAAESVMHAAGPR